MFFEVKLRETRKTPKRTKTDDQSSSPSPFSKSSKKDNVTATSCNKLFPNFSSLMPEEYRTIRDDLLALHGFPKEFIKYRKQISLDHIRDKSDDISGNECCNESVLDGLISTILSQSTTEANSYKAFASLKSSFPTWECVLAADANLVEDTL
ncbi:hypothetical protein P3L10_015835 [Capsicum annuum]